MKKETTITELLIALIKNTVKIIAFSLAVAIAVGALVLLTPSAQAETGESEQLESITKTVKNKENALKTLEEYMAKSIYANFDPFAVPMSEISFIVETDYKIDPTLTYQDPDRTLLFRDAYLKAYLSQEVFAYYKESIGKKELEDKYIDECIRVETVSGNNIISIRVFADDLQVASKVSDFIFEYSQDQVTKNMGNHTIQLISKKDQISVHGNITAHYDMIVQKISDSRNELENYEKDLKAVAIESEHDFKDNLKKFIKFGIVGGALGFIIAVSVIILLELNSCKIRNLIDIERNLSPDFDNIGILPFDKENKLKLTQKFINRIIPGYYTDKDMDQAIDFIIVTLKFYMKDSIKSILLVGDLSDKKSGMLINEIEKSCDVKVKKAMSLHFSASAREDLYNSDAVILIAKQNRTTLQQVKDDIEFTKQAKKNILGYILNE